MRRRSPGWPVSCRFLSAGNSSRLMNAIRSSPVMPSGSAAQVRHWKLLRDRRAIALLHQLELFVLVADDLEEEHPAQLRDALGVAIDAGILAHDVLNRFDGGTNGHGRQLYGQRSVWSSAHVCVEIWITCAVWDQSACGVQFGKCFASRSWIGLNENLAIRPMRKVDFAVL